MWLAGATWDECFPGPLLECSTDGYAWDMGNSKLWHRSVSRGLSRTAGECRAREHGVSLLCCAVGRGGWSGEGSAASMLLHALSPSSSWVCEGRGGRVMDVGARFLYILYSPSSAVDPYLLTHVCPLLSTWQVCDSALCDGLCSTHTREVQDSCMLLHV